MILLADTCIALWSVLEPARLTPFARTTITERTTVLLLSYASLWEISIKQSKGKLVLGEPFELFAGRLARLGFTFVAIELQHLVRQNALPFHHRDPFDRMLVAQALVEDLPVLSVDGRFRDYGVRVLT